MHVQSVLIVEDSPMVLKIIKHLAAKTLNFKLVYATTRAEALTHLAQEVDWLAAIVDLNLPDAPDGELVDDCLEQGIPSIVLTGSVNKEKREALTKKGIVDYVLKEGRFSYLYAVNLVNRLSRNRFIKVLVAEDSKMTRRYMVELLKRHLFEVVEAEDGEQALQKILSDNQIKLLITDNNMPKMDGFDLVHQLRHKYNNHDLVAIGLSSAEDKYLSAKFIKNGANDFLYKPFSHEEFYCRVMQGVESMERLESMKKIAYSDALTSIGNRRYFIETSREELKNCTEQNLPAALALINVDHFKDINEDYGHDVGDEVLVHIAKMMAATFDRFILARTGGEEFCVLFPGLTGDRASQLLEVFRSQVEDGYAQTDAGSVSMTISIGVAQAPNLSLESLMKNAGSALYRAKVAGRNTVIISE
ncbi:MAG: diguanylate cyclase (GGDEF)-like protein [Reinekea sp.]|jgi:diguanylate cyclase (GGDEF)-like protein